MKTCKKCKIDYPDSENFCMNCGRKLKPVEQRGMEERIKNMEKILERITYFPYDELISLIAQLGELESDVGFLKEKMDSVKPMKPKEIREDGSLRQIIENLKRETENNRVQMQRLMNDIEDLQSLRMNVDSLKKGVSKTQRVSEVSNRIQEATVGVRTETKKIISDMLESLNEKIDHNAESIAKVGNRMREVDNKLMLDQETIKQKINKIIEQEKRQMLKSAGKDASSYLNEMNRTIRNFKSARKDLDEKIDIINNLVEEIETRTKMDIEDLAAELSTIKKDKSTKGKMISNETRNINKSIMQMKKSISSLKNETSNISASVNENAEQIDNLNLHIDKTKEDIHETHIKGIESDFYREIDSLKDQIKDTLERTKGAEERIETKEKEIEERLKHLSEQEKKMKNINEKELVRELEMLKSKVQWLGDKLEKVDVDRITEKIDNIETKLRSKIASSPLILE